MDTPSQLFSSQAQKSSEKMGKDELSRKVSEMVRYFIMNDRKKIPIKRQDINKFVMKEHVKAFPVVFEKAKNQLAVVFGIDVIETETVSKSKIYILVNQLATIDQNWSNTLWNEDSCKAGLLLILLSLIYMNEGVVSDVLLWCFLKQLGISKDSKIQKDFGDAEKIIQEFTRQMYLTRDKVAGPEGPTFYYKWGVRSKLEITKRKVLSFISEVYGVSIESWRMQYREILEEEGRG